MNKPNVLFLTHRVPFPPDRGDRIRSYHILRFLSERANVHLGCLADEPPTAGTTGELRRLCDHLEIVPTHPRLRWVRASACLATGRSATEGLFASNRLQQTVRSWTRETRYDAVVVFCSSMLQFAQDKRLNTAVRLIDLVDVDSQKWFDYAAKTRGLKRMLYKLEGRRLRKLECRLPEQGWTVTLVSEQEADIYRGFADRTAAHAVSNGVDLEFFEPATERRTPAAPEFVFVGVLNYWANVEGLIWFCENVWPEIRHRLPGATFSLVGKQPSPAVKKLGELDGVTLIGEVDDVREYLSRATAILVPLRIARGIQNKVLEALAMARPVVASSQALEGLATCSGEHVLAADTPQAWIEQIESLSADENRQLELGRAGRSYVEQHHSWDARLAPLAELLNLPHPQLLATIASGRS